MRPLNAFTYSRSSPKRRARRPIHPTGTGAWPSEPWVVGTTSLNSPRTAIWGRHLWGRGYLVCSSGNVTDETIAEYIRLQGAAPPNDDRFQVSEE
jgi:REP element-mobilizing transposase RayT